MEPFELEDGLREAAPTKALVVDIPDSHDDAHLRPGMPVSFSELYYRITVKKRVLELLKGLEGCFRPGEVTALMGPSGSGKTTLLDVLSGRKTTGKIEGRILYGCAPPTRIFLRRHTAYVEQFDTLLPTLTVFEMLLYTAEMKLPGTMPTAEKRRLVKEVIDFLSLTSCEHTPIGGVTKRGISGGQAKRTNIGVSLITKPQVVFLDEPTSGLDSFTSDGVMAVVRRFAEEKGATVCATIHSPTPKTFAVFDRLLLLVAGREVYFGECGMAAIEYFSNQGMAHRAFELEDAWTSQAEWITELITAAGLAGNRPAEMARAFEKSDLFQHNRRMQEVAVRGAAVSDMSPVSISRRHVLSSYYAEEAAQKGGGRDDKETSVSMGKGLKTFFRYRTLRNYRDPLWMSARVIDKLIVLSIMVTLYLKAGSKTTFKDAQLTASMLFMWTATPGFGAAAYLPSLMLERPVYYRELNDGIYYPITYYTAKWIEELLVAVPATLVFSLALWFAVQLQGSFGVFWFAGLLTQLTAVALAFTFATVSPTVDFAAGAVPSYGGTLLFFTGFLVVFNDIPSWWTWYSYLAYTRYPFTAMMVNQFGGSNLDITQCPGVQEVTILDYYSMRGDSPAANLVYTMLWLAGFAALAFVFLKCLNYSRR